MYLLVVYFPLLGFIVASTFGRLIGEKGAVYATVGCMILAELCAIYLFYEVGLSGSVCTVKLFEWFDMGLMEVYWGFLFDSVTVVMLIVVCTVSLLVHIFSVGYMAGDPHFTRFMSYLSLFTFMMLMLVTSDNFVQMFLGWEGVGLSSFLLINFWYTRLQANKAALKAIVMNRFGDLGIMLTIVSVFSLLKTLDYNAVFSLIYLFTDKTMFLGTIEVNYVEFISFCIFLGAVGKSAQLGLHTWLPDAMEGPTPVSALIHAATMVTAGVFVLIRCSPILEFSVVTLNLVVIFGGLTAFFAATVGVMQNDLKKVIAYSTCSQLGYMVFACGLSYYSVGMFHLMNHAFFKALLFLSAGSVIHALVDEQDMRRMGGLMRLLPLTYVMMVIGSLSLMGFPFLTGFYSKDLILELSQVSYAVSGSFVFWLGTISAFFTAFYSIRLLYLTFLSEPMFPKGIVKFIHDSPLIMCIPLMVLGVGSIFVGYIFRDMMVGLGTDFWGSAIFSSVNSSDAYQLRSEFMSVWLKQIPVFFSCLGGLLSFFIYKFFTYELYLVNLTVKGKIIYSFLNKKWYFDLLYNRYLADTMLNFGYNISFKLIDRGLIEVLGPTGMIRTFEKLITNISTVVTGKVYHYAYIMVFSLLFLFLYLTEYSIYGYFVGLEEGLIYVYFVIIYYFWDKDDNFGS